MTGDTSPEGGTLQSRTEHLQENPPAIYDIEPIDLSQNPSQAMSSGERSARAAAAIRYRSGIRWDLASSQTLILIKSKDNRRLLILLDIQKQVGHTHLPSTTILSLRIHLLISSIKSQYSQHTLQTTPFTNKPSTAHFARNSAKARDATNTFLIQDSSNQPHQPHEVVNHVSVHLMAENSWNHTQLHHVVKPGSPASTAPASTLIPAHTCISEGADRQQKCRSCSGTQFIYHGLGAVIICTCSSSQKYTKSLERGEYQSHSSELVFFLHSACCILYIYRAKLLTGVKKQREKRKERKKEREKELPITTLFPNASSPSRHERHRQQQQQQQYSQHERTNG